MKRLLTRLAGDQSGATAIEYGLICALIFVVIVSAVTAFGESATGVFITATETLVGAITG